MNNKDSQILLRARADELYDTLYSFIKEVSGNTSPTNANWKETFYAHIRVGRFLVFSVLKDEELLFREYLDE